MYEKYNILLEEAKKNISSFANKCNDDQINKLNEASYDKVSGKYSDDNLLDLYELNETIKQYL